MSCSDPCLMRCLRLSPHPTFLVLRVCTRCSIFNRCEMRKPKKNETTAMSNDSWNSNSEILPCRVRCRLRRLSRCFLQGKHRMEVSSLFPSCPFPPRLVVRSRKYLARHALARHVLARPIHPLHTHPPNLRSLHLLRNSGASPYLPRPLLRSRAHKHRLGSTDSALLSRKWMYRSLQCHWDPFPETSRSLYHQR